jgi:hypothetical protein
MDPEVPALNDDMRVQDAIAAVQSYSSAHERLYLIDRNRQLTGTVEFRKLLVAYPEMPIRDLAEKPEYTLPARASLATVRDHPVWVMQAMDTLGRAAGGADELTEFLFSFVETLWAAGAELFVRGEGPAGRRKGA